jgi:hypothetical protein
MTHEYARTGNSISVPLLRTVVEIKDAHPEHSKRNTFKFPEIATYNS